jgi:transposase
VPDQEDEAMRDLIRGRQDAVKGLRTARQHLGAFLLRHGIRYGRKTSWGTAHARWLADVKMAHPAQQITLQEYIDTVRQGTERVDRLTGKILDILPQWRMFPVVKALQSLRGVAPIVASTIVAEVGDISRFQSPRKLMAYLGLVPSEHSSGDKVSRGGITKTGNTHARRVLVEAAQTYSYPARVSRLLLKRQEGVPQCICDIAWQAQVRLCGRFRKLSGRGKSRNTVVAAIARELSGFMWAIAQQVQV